MMSAWETPNWGWAAFRLLSITATGRFFRKPGSMGIPDRGIRPGRDVGLRLHRFHRLLHRRRVRLFLFHRLRADPAAVSSSPPQKDRPQPFFIRRRLSFQVSSDTSDTGKRQGGIRRGSTSHLPLIAGHQAKLQNRFGEKHPHRRQDHPKHRPQPNRKPRRCHNAPLQHLAGYRLGPAAGWPTLRSSLASISA